MREYPTIRIIDGENNDQEDEFQQSVREAWCTNAMLPEQWKSVFDRYEREKTEQELHLISVAEDATNAFCVTYGREPLQLHADKIHILPQAALKEIGALSQLDGGGISFPFAGQVVLVDEIVRRHPIAFMKVLTHELIHLKSFLSADQKGQRRAGLRTRLRSGSHGFTGLDEALTEMAVFECLITSMRDPQFSATIKPVFSKAGGQARLEYAKKLGAPQGEVLWAHEDLTDGQTLSYFTQRDILLYVTKSIAQDHPERFSSHKDVRTLFFQAKFQGNMTDLGRLIEESFGKDSLRLVAEIPGDEVKAEAIIPKLQELRAAVVAIS